MAHLDVDLALFGYRLSFGYRLTEHDDTPPPAPIVKGDGGTFGFTPD